MDAKEAMTLKRKQVHVLLDAVIAAGKRGGGEGKAPGACFTFDPEYLQISLEDGGKYFFEQKESARELNDKYKDCMARLCETDDKESLAGKGEKWLERDRMHALLDAVISFNEAGGQIRYSYTSDWLGKSLTICLAGTTDGYAFINTDLGDMQRLNDQYEACMAYLRGLACRLPEAPGVKRKDIYEVYKENYAAMQRLFLKHKEKDWSERDTRAICHDSETFQDNLHGMLQLMEDAGIITSEERWEKSKKMVEDFSVIGHYGFSHSVDDDDALIYMIRPPEPTPEPAPNSMPSKSRKMEKSR